MAKYEEGAVSPSGKYVVKGGQWVPATKTTGAPKLTAADQATLAEAGVASNTLPYTATRLKEFEKLNAKAPTGPVYGNGLWGFNPVNLFKGENLQQMEAINNELAPQQRAPGSGATSDIEYKGMKLALPSIEKYGNANAAASRNIQEKAREAQARKAFLDQYAAEKGSLIGAETAFDSYWMPKRAKEKAAGYVPARQRNYTSTGGKSPPRKASGDKFVKGQTYTDANGNQATYLGDGKWRE